MNRTKHRTLSVVAACSAVFVVGMALAACSGPKPELVSISVGGQFETRYLVGDSLNTAGMLVTANFSDGTSRTLVRGEYTVAPEGRLGTANTELTVSYGEMTATRKISVGSDLTNETAIKSDFAPLTFTEDGKSIAYRIRKPDNDDVPRPLVLFLHGAGERGNDNDLQLKNAILKTFLSFKSPMYDATVIAPQCPASSQWVNWPWANGNYSTAEIAETNELALVYRLVQSYAADTELVDASRIYVIGLSMGGFGTWDLLARHGETFAAGVPMCGGGDPSCAAALAEIPIFTFHGDKDTTVPVAGTREMVDKIKAEGKGLLHYVEYVGKSHNIWNDAIQFKGDSKNPVLLDWLFAQRKTAAN